MCKGRFTINPFSRMKSKLGRQIFGLKNRILRDRRFLQSAEKARGTEASSLINSIYDLNKSWKCYLEIGVEYGFTFEAVKISRKIGVDPVPKFNTFFKHRNIGFSRKTSDHFFESTKCSFDFIYLDGLHTFDQTWMDIKNSSRVLADGGMLLIDDTVPCDEFSALADQQESYRQRNLAGKAETGSWHGDVFRVLWVLSEFFAEDVDWYTLVELQNPKTLVVKKSKDSYFSIFNRFIEIDSASNKTFLETFNGSNNNVIRPTTLSELLMHLDS